MKHIAINEAIARNEDEEARTRVVEIN